MVDHIVDASERRSRIDIRTGIGRRRRWSDEAKGRVVAASYEPGAVVSEVARRHDITPTSVCMAQSSVSGALSPSCTVWSDPEDVADLEGMGSHIWLTI